MILDLADGARTPDEVFDVCVVGTGPAGTTVVAELAGAGLSVVVLESGRRRTTRRGDALRRTVSTGIKVKDYSRERVLGGASTTWAGLSSPLDAVDLEPRAVLGGAAWPFGRDELDPYYRAASERYRFAPLEMFDEEQRGAGFRELRDRGRLAPAWRGLDEKVFLACAEPQDFGAEHRAVFERDDVTLLLDATALHLEGEGDETRVVVVADSAGGRHRVRARTFVLATGGIENARLLLASTDRCAAGLGNERDQVGRGLMNHPKNYRGVIHLAEPVRDEPYVFGCLRRGYAGYAGLRLPLDVQAERGLLNSYIRFEPLFPWSSNRGVEAFVLFVKRSGFVLKAWTRRRQDDVITIRDYSETGDDSELQNARKSFFEWLGLVGTVVRHAPSVARYVWARLRDGSAPRVTRVRLRNFMEMEPHPDNRVTLSDELDENGQRLPRVHHDTTALDRRSMVAVQEVLAAEVERLGLGRLETDLADADPWPIDQDASHHLGTTRMGTDPERSVVDPDLRLHGSANVYLAGGSVFPTSGCANPTMTIVALSVRLARHLRRDVFGKSVGAVFDEPVRPWRDPDRAPRTLGAAGAGRPWFVIGAGRRVCDDVLPVLAARGAHVAGVFARSRRVVDVGDQELAVRPLDELRREDVPDDAIVYVGVSKPAVPDTLAALERLDPARLELVVDTPVFLWKHLAHVRRIDAWRRASVAEDCATLPWVTLLAQELGPARRVVFDRSAYRYHGYAMMRELLGARSVTRARRSAVTTDLGPGTAYDLTFDGGATGRLVEPRDYAAGRWELEAADGRVVVDGPAGEPDPDVLRPVVRDGLCVGFTLGDAHVDLTDAESRVVGAFADTDTVTSRMDALKRAGLVRMFDAIERGDGGYPLDDALDDMLVDAALEKLGRYRGAGPLSIKTPSGRRWLVRATGLLSSP